MHSGFLPSIFSFFLQFPAHFFSFTPFFTRSHLFVHFCEETQQSPLCIQLWSLNFRILCLISKGSYRHIGRIIVFIRVLKDTNLHSHSRHMCQLQNLVVIRVTAGAYIYLYPKAGSNLPQYVYKSDLYSYHWHLYYLCLLAPHPHPHPLCFGD